MTTTKTLNEADLRHFTGTEHYYRHSLCRDYVYTDGVKYAAETGGAYWLIDEIFFHQKNLKSEQFQTWVLTVQNNVATLTATDGNGKKLVEEGFIYSDFPLAKIMFYLCDNVLMLTSEY